MCDRLWARDISSHCCQFDRPHDMQEVGVRVKSEKQSDRLELMQLCEGLRYLRLPASTTDQVIRTWAAKAAVQTMSWR